MIELNTDQIGLNVSLNIFYSSVNFVQSIRHPIVIWHNWYIYWNLGMADLFTV